MLNPIKYTDDEFLEFYNTQTKAIEALDKVITKFKTGDKKTLIAIKTLLGLEEGFEIRFDMDNLKVSHVIEMPHINTFYQICLKIIDKETTKDISRNTYICGLIKDGKPSRNFEIKQIEGKTKAKETKRT